MAFFTRFDIQDFTITGVMPKSLPRTKNYDCGLDISYNSTIKRYEYKFECESYVLWNPEDTLTFNLNDMTGGLADLWLLKYTCTEPETVILINIATGKEDIPANIFANKAKSVRMILQLNRHKLVHVGLIVVIAPKDGSETTYLLCDPQVGSGPP